MTRLFREIWLILVILSSFYSSQMMISSASDSINTTDTIRDNQTLVSSGGVFELGFFSPGRSNNWYLGIWYKNIPNMTVVWVANREIPLKNRSSGALRVIPPGRLILVNDTNATIWSANSSRTAQDNPVAQLLDSGNLVLRDGNDNRPGNYLWQSFDYPSNTLLPGLKLGFSDSVYLTSWKSEEDPAPGDYLYYLDQAGYPQVFIKRDGIDRFRVGPWNGLVFSGLPYVRNDSTFSFGVYRTEEGRFYNEEEALGSDISRMYLDPTGELQRLRWVDQTQSWVFQLGFPVDNCDAYNSCGAYGSCNVANFPICECLNKFEPKDPQGWSEGDWSSNGCVRRTPLDCRAGDGFVKYSNLKLPDARSAWHNETMMLEECQAECLRNCSCMAYTTLNISGRGSGCLIWFGNLPDIRVLPIDGQDLYIRMASSEIGSNGKNKKLMVSLIIVGTALLILIGLLLCIWKRKSLMNPTGGYAESHSKNMELPLFNLSTISKATNNFAFQNKLGEGGFGPVYKGKLQDGQDIAVKRLSETSKQGMDEFLNEVNFIATLQHRNLVKLLGCCIQGEEKMLVYEYMPNKSLDTVLFSKNQNNRISLEWPKRFHIANGIARGLVYLHQDSRLRIIHRDLKASNILLDSEMNPKISDFGIARKYRENETEDLTSRIVGTYGYMSPEYAVGGRISIKSDVFSFGVIVLEIVSGKRNSSYSHGDRHLNLLGHVWTLHKEGRATEITDSNLQELENIEQVQRLIHVGLLCVQQNPNDRPSMTSVVSMLSNDSELPQPSQPGFFTDTSTSSNASTNPTTSSNEMTITLLGGR